VLALLAQLFAFHAGWGPPPVPPPPPPAMISPGRAVAEALWYCRDRGFACRADGARLARADVWRVRLDVARRYHRGEMVVDLDAWSGQVLAVYGHPGWVGKWKHEGWKRRGWDWD
jgi:hypothetical protein